MKLRSGRMIGEPKKEENAVMKEEPHVVMKDENDVMKEEKKEMKLNDFVEHHPYVSEYPCHKYSDYREVRIVSKDVNVQLKYLKSIMREPKHACYHVKLHNITEIAKMFNDFDGMIEYIKTVPVEANFVKELFTNALRYNQKVRFLNISNQKTIYKCICSLEEDMKSEFLSKQIDLEIIRKRHEERIAYNRSLINEKDVLTLKRLIETKKYNFFYDKIKLEGKNIDQSEKLLWKDFLLCFKQGFSLTMNTIPMGTVLRELLHIDQDKHVLSGIRLSFEEWLKLNTASNVKDQENEDEHDKEQENEHEHVHEESDEEVDQDKDKTNKSSINVNIVNIPQCENQKCLHTKYADAVQRMQSYRSMEYKDIPIMMLTYLHSYQSVHHCLPIKSDYLMRACKILLDFQDVNVSNNLLSLIERKVNEMKNIHTTKTFHLTEEQNKVYNEFSEMVKQKL